MYGTILICVGLFLCVGMGFAAYPLEGPTLFTDTQAQEMLDEIRANLEAVQPLVADVECNSNRPWLDFADGAIAIQGETEMRLDKGTLGEVWWRNDIGYNVSGAPGSNGEISWARWDENDPPQNAYYGWGNSNGIEDVRVALGMGEMYPGGLTLDNGEYTINGIVCKMLSGDDLRLYIDAAHQHRLIRVEVDIAWTNNVIFSTDFLQWQTCAGGEYPCLVIAQRFLNDPNEEDSEWVYTCNNVQGQATLPPGMFDLEKGN